jgi:hypothetical protein
MMTTGAMENFPPASYRRLCSLRRRGLGYRAAGPCAIPGCEYAARAIASAARYKARLGYPPPPIDRPLSPLFVWDHCHAHDYVRGVLCRDCNQKISPWDRQDHWVLRHRQERQEAMIAYRARCPECANLGSWTPIAVRHDPARVHRSKYLAAMSERAVAQRVLHARLLAEQKAAQDRRRASALKGVATRRARRAGTKTD